MPDEPGVRIISDMGFNSSADREFDDFKERRNIGMAGRCRKTLLAVPPAGALSGLVAGWVAILGRRPTIPKADGIPQGLRIDFIY